jgi:hypothetical protein
MLPFEWIAAVYFLSLAVASVVFSRSDNHRAWHALAISLGVVVAIVGFSRLASMAIREWVGHGYLVLGYWIPALLAGTGRSTPFEVWLLRSDAVLRRRPIAMAAWVRYSLELAYLLCYFLVPAAFVSIWTRGTAEDVNRFWVSALGAGFVCYGTLPWLVSRPPRAIHPATPEPHVVSTFNALILRRVSHGLNTFPSGHVAVSVAAALNTLAVWLPVGVVFSVVSVGIAGGAAVGRYHYVVDVLLGLLVGVAFTLIGWAI